jgi:telomerase protein component 1
MAGTWRTARVFISSTFRDMHAERDHLVKVVFPELRERLAPYRIELIDVDLRWGVTREQAENDRALDVCLHWIDECRPFFVGLLGQRYGWVPSRFPAEALSHYGWVQHETGKSLTELEILFGVLLMDPRMRGWSFFYFRDPKALDGVPAEIRQAVYVETETEATRKLADLKDRIRKSGYPVYDGYPARWDPEAYDRPSGSLGRLGDLDAFGDRVRDQLWEAIKAEHREAIKAEHPLPEEPPAATLGVDLAEEADDHERFMESRLRVYIGRQDLHDALIAFADGSDPFPGLVTGPSGSGKSAALARFVTEYRQSHPDVLVIPHFIGASPRSAGLRDPLRRLCGGLADRFGFDDEVPQEINLLVNTFRCARLSLAGLVS